MNIIDLETPLNTLKYVSPTPYGSDYEPFYITEYGKTFSGTPCYQLRMSSPIACVQYVVSGGGIIICDDKIYTVKKGDSFLLPVGSDQIYYSNPDNCFERVWLNFRGELAEAMLRIYGIRDRIIFRGTDTHELIAKIQEECRRLSEPFDETEYKDRTSQLFLGLIQKLSKSEPITEETADSIEQIRLFIDRNITKNLKIEDIARQFSFSNEHIIRLFKRNYGITPHQYILQSKIRLAMIMLKMTDTPIEFIAEKLSFSDSHHFSAQFKKLMGYKPSDYRKNNNS